MRQTDTGTTTFTGTNCGELRHLLRAPAGTVETSDRTAEVGAELDSELGASEWLEGETGARPSEGRYWSWRHEAGIAFVRAGARSRVDVITDALGAMVRSLCTAGLMPERPALSGVSILAGGGVAHHVPLSERDTSLTAPASIVVMRELAQAVQAAGGGDGTVLFVWLPSR